MKTPPPATEASDAELERFKAWLAINDPRPFTPGAYSYQAAKWKAWQAALSYPAAAVGGGSCPRCGTPNHEDGDGITTICACRTNESPPAGGFVVPQDGVHPYYLNHLSIAADKFRELGHNGHAIILDDILAALSLPRQNESQLFNPPAFGLACTVAWTELVQALRTDGHTVADKSGPTVRKWIEAIVRDTFAASPAAQPSAKDGVRGEESGYRPATPEEEADIDAAAGLVKLTLRLPADLHKAIEWYAFRRQCVIPAAIREILEQATTATGLVDGYSREQIMAGLKDHYKMVSGDHREVPATQMAHEVMQAIEKAAIGREVGDV